MLLQTETIPGLPPVAGLSLRPVRGAEDADGVYALRLGCVEADQVDLDSTSESLPSRDEIAAMLARCVASEQSGRRLVAEIAGQIVGYTLVEEWFERDGRWVFLILGWVLPAWRGRGIGSAMLHWGEATARQLATHEHRGMPFEFAANASSTQHDATALLLNAGYRAGYTVLEMGLDLAAMPSIHPMPPGVEVRLARPEHIPAIAHSMQEAYRDEYDGNRFQESHTYDESVAGLSTPEHDPALWQIAWYGQQVVGNVIPVVQDRRAYLYDISVRPAWRRQGLARALLTRALWDLRQRGLTVIRLNTVAEFPTRARDLYTSVGFRLLKEFPRYRKAPD